MRLGEVEPVFGQTGILDITARTAHDGALKWTRAPSTPRAILDTCRGLYNAGNEQRHAIRNRFLRDEWIRSAVRKAALAWTPNGFGAFEAARTEGE